MTALDQKTGSRNFSFRRIAWPILLLLAGASAHAQFAVSSDGTPTYSQAIAVPPGRAGMSPNIGLFYAGGGVNGPVGHGWSVRGLSVITRCPPSYTVDGVRGSVAYAPADKLCLDGQRLIETDGAGNPLATQANDAQGLAGGYREYRTEKDSYARVRAYGAANGDAANGPLYFKVWTKSGQIYEYGKSPSTDANALAQPYGKSVVMAWPVARISDTLGNFIDFKYEQRDVAWGSVPTPAVGSTSTASQTGHEWNILEIQYSGNKVVFKYEDRTNTPPLDASETYHLSDKNVSTKRLRYITTYVNSSTALGASGTPVRTTALTYTAGSVSGRSLLTRIQECAGDFTSTRCLPPTDFGYSAGGDEAYVASSKFDQRSLAMLPSSDGLTGRGALVGDFNGDGKSDFIRWVDPAVSNQLYVSNGDGSFTQSGAFNLTNESLFSTNGCTISLLADFNGDGLPDILRFAATNVPGGITCPGYASTVYLNNGDGTFASAAVGGPALDRRSSINCPYNPNNWYPSDFPSECARGDDPTHAGWTKGANFYLLDVNGDGKTDIVTTILPVYNRWDIEGDSCAYTTCTHVWQSNGDGSFTELTTNLTHTSVYSSPMRGFGFGGPRNISDLDGDGLADLNGISTVYFNPSASFKSQGNGNFTPVAGGLSCITPIDFNGDGREECLIAGFNGDYANNSLTVSDGTGTPLYASNFNLKSSGQELSGSDPNQHNAANVGFVIADINGDGRADILRWKDDATQNTVYLSNGDGTFRSSISFQPSMSGYPLSKSDGTISFALGDFRGLGNTEILRMKDSDNALLVKGTSTPPDQLSSVTTATGANTALYYVPLSNATQSAGVTPDYGPRYTSDRGTSNKATGTKVDLTLPQYVVATTVADSGVGGSTVKTEYSYAGLKVDTSGRGILGFRETQRQAPGPNGQDLTVWTTYLQDFPYIGVASHTETRKGTLGDANALLLSRTSNVYCDTTNDVSAGEGAPCPVTAKVARPYLRQSVETGQDLAGNALPTVTTANTMNGDGDPLTINVTTTGTAAGVSQTFTKLTTNTYYADNTDCSADETCYWILGRLNRATVRNTVPNSLAQIATGVGNGSAATSGSGTAPLPVRLTQSLDFGVVPVGQTKRLDATLSNNGTSAVSVTIPNSSSVTGTDFRFRATTCKSSLPAGSSCTVSVEFRPSAPVPRSGTLTVATALGTFTTSLTGGPSGATLTASLSWGNVDVSTPTTLTATLANSGTAPVSVTAPTASSVTGTDFSFASSDCPASLAAGASCSIGVTFNPSANASRTGTLTVVAGGSTLTSSLSGTGVNAVTLTSPLAFGNVVVKTSATLTATLRNAMPTSLSVTVPTTSAVSGTYFSFVSTTCTSSIAAGASCTIDVNFTPGSTGSRSGSLTVNTGAGKFVSNLTGTAVTATVGLTAINFGTASLGSSKTMTATLSNTGSSSTSVTLPPTVAGSEFSYAAGSTTCSSTLAANSSCAIGVTFTPTASGSHTGTLTVVTDVMTLSSGLSGSIPSATLTPNLSFDSVNVGESVPLAAVLKNTGTGPLSVTVPDPSSVVGTGFAFGSTNCPSSLSAGASCNVSVTFTPNDVGSFAGSLTVATGAGTKTSNFSGTGSSGVAEVPTFNPATLNFGSVNVSSTNTLTTTLTNSGTVALTGISPAAVTGQYFSLAGDNCPTGLVVGASCTITVNYAPGAAGSHSGSVSIPMTYAGTQVITLSGTAGTVKATMDTSVQFGSVYVNSSKTMTATVTNTGTLPVAITLPPTVSGPGFSYVAAPSNACTSSLAVGASCNIGVKFAPTDFTTSNGTLTVNTADGPKSATLTGTGANPISLGAIDFGTVTANTTLTETSTLYNNGSTNLTLNLPPTVSGAGFSYPGSGDTCSTYVLAGRSCIFNVSFTPPSSGTQYNGTLAVGVVELGTSVSAALTGAGGQPAAPNISASPTSLNFGNQLDGVTVTQTFTVTNSGTSGTFSKSITIDNGGAFSFGATTCPVNGGTMAGGGASCTIDVKFTGAGYCPPATITQLTGHVDVSVGTSSAAVQLTGQTHVYLSSDPFCSNK